MADSAEIVPVPTRLARISDVQQILALEQHTSTAAHWTADQYNKLVENGLVFLAKRAGYLCGFIAAQILVDEWEIQNLVVAAQVRRQGIAAELVRQVVNCAREQKASRILLDVRESNLAARALYEKMGFALEGVRPGYYENPDESAILYSLRP